MRLKARVVDATMINDELDMLLLRLEYLSPFVDHFYVAESQETFTGSAKPLYVTENRQMLAQYWDRITIVRYACPDANSPWEREAASRSALRTALTAEPDGVVLLGDLDEFPSREQLSQIAAIREPCSVPVDTYYRRANWRLEGESPLFALKASPVRALPKDLTQLRWPPAALRAVEGDRGGHFSYMGFTPQQLAGKLSAFSHTEFAFAAAEADRLLQVADDLALDHFGRSRQPGAGLLSVLPPTAWSDTHWWLHSRRPEWFDTTRRSRDLWRRVNAAAIDYAMVARDPDVLATIGRPSVWRQPGVRRAVFSRLGTERRRVLRRRRHG